MKVALIGRPNVGKSTLFNRLIGKRLSLVDDQPGVTRDRKEGHLIVDCKQVSFIDTAGVVPNGTDDLSKGMNEQTFSAISEAVGVLFVVDAIDGVTWEDKDISKWLRGVFKKIGNKPILVVANKSENKKARLTYFEELGFGEALPISAEHNIGLEDLYEWFTPFYVDCYSEEDDQKPRFAFVGRPNAGKSTLINALINEPRLLTSSMAGTTRDSIPVDWSYKGRDLTFIDTAGQRRHSRVGDRLESLSLVSARNSIGKAHVSFLVLDATCPLEKQDLTIARNLVERGRGFVIALNKWDLIKDKKGLLKEIKETMETSFYQIKNPMIVPVSAKKKSNFEELLDAAITIFERRRIRIGTSELNRWLECAVSACPPPLVSGRPITLKYITQIGSCPPSFMAVGTRLDHMPDSYARYLVNGIIENFGLNGIPVKISFKQKNNPYDNTKEK